MNISEALEILEVSLIAYVDDCAGRETEEAKQIDKAFQTIKDKLAENGQLFYYAVWDGTDYLHSGLNYTDPDAVKSSLIELNEPHLSDEYVEKLKDMTLDEVCSQFGYRLERNARPV